MEGIRASYHSSDSKDLRFGCSNYKDFGTGEGQLSTSGSRTSPGSRSTTQASTPGPAQLTN